MMSGKLELTDGFICKKCFYDMGGTIDAVPVASRKMSLDELKSYIRKHAEEIQIASDFKPTMSIGDLAKFNDDKQEVLLTSKSKIKYKPTDYTLFSYSQIVGYEILEDGSTIAQGGLGRAAVGGVLFGGAGAIVGAATRKQKGMCNSLQVKVTVKDYFEPAFFIPIITTSVKKTGIVYKAGIESAEKIASALEIIVKENETANSGQHENSQSSGSDAADEIRKFKGLLDDGIITQEEFDAKKKQLLGL